MLCHVKYLLYIFIILELILIDNDQRIENTKYFQQSIWAAYTEGTELTADIFDKITTKFWHETLDGTVQ